MQILLLFLSHVVYRSREGKREGGEYMKKYLLVLLGVFSLTGLFAQNVDLSEVSVEDIDFSMVDLSDVEFYFQGPIEFYVRGIEYGGMSYAAILDFDGISTFTVKVPGTITTVGKPMNVKLEDISAGFGSDGIRLKNVVVDGYRYSGTLVLNKNQELAISTYQRGSKDVVSTTVASTSKDDGGAQKEIESLKSEISKLENQLDSAEGQITQLNRQVASMKDEGEEAAWMTASSRLTSTLLSGFSRGSGVSGSWSVSGGNLMQNDADSKFAKFAVPVTQTRSELLYVLEGRAAGSGWQGYGLHFLASGSKQGAGWGYGTSYLVWVTRDQDHFRNQKTYVQLYKSMSDSEMIEITSSVADFSITGTNEVEVYVDKNSGNIVVSSGGQRLFSYSDDDFISSGSTVAVRALGSARITDLTVKGK